MSVKITREKYAMMYGPTTGDRVRLADTSLVIEVEKILQPTGKKANSEAVKPFGTVWDNL